MIEVNFVFDGLMWPWVLFGLAAGLALALGGLWYRARGELLAVKHRVAQVERVLRANDTTIHQLQGQLHALMEATPQAILILGAERRVLALNAAAQTLFGLQATLGQSLIAATRSVELDDLAAHCLGNGADCDRQVTLGRNNQPYRARAVAAATAQDNETMVLVLQDLSELQRLGRARRDFVANISHELRTPITSIRLLVDTLRGGAGTHGAGAASAAPALLEKIAIETEALAQLAQELLDLAQMESGQTLIRMVPAQLASLVEAVVTRLRPQAEHKQQTIQVEVSTTLQVLADPDQLNRVLSNLLHNAIKFTPPGGQVWVRAYAQPTEALIEVADNGPGVAPELLQRVFERFFRGDKSRAGGGTGLGLAIAKHVVEAHGGKIWAESAGRPGQGVVFRFTLLLAEA